MTKLLFQKGWPSYLYAVTMGATTIWERWDGWTPEKGFQDPGMNSFNHYAYGAIGEWLYQRLAGLDTDRSSVGYKKLVLRPMPVEGLEFAKATLDTPYGKASSGWKRSGKKVVYKFTVPPNTSAVAYLPGEEKPRELQPGKHEFEVKI
jgi:alpha-L-rhamnosidase